MSSGARLLLSGALLGSVAASLLLYGSAAHANLIVNGDFESGNTGFATSYAFDPAATNTCPNCLDAAEYIITADASQHHPVGLQYGDHTSGSGLFLMANGASTQLVVWSQTVGGISANTAYRLDAFMSTWLNVNDPSPSNLDFRVNGVSVGTLLGSGASGVWQGFSSVFNSGAAVSLIIEIRDLNTVGSGNDFALDDVSLNQVPEPATLLLLPLGLAGLALRRNARRR